jgi:gliding motility associated protien GldN
MRTFSVVTIAFIMAFLSSGSTIFAQDSKPEVYEKIHIPHKKPIPYPYTREADVMWTKTIWRMIDLREKMNLPLFFPTKPIGERMSLISLLFYGIDNEGLQTYDPYKGVDEFKVPMSKEDLERQMDNVPKDVQVADTTGQMVTKHISGERKMDQIKKILVKEKWFFDKNYSTMEVRILGLCPIRVYPREIKGAANQDEENAEMLLKEVCWIYYPEARSLLASHPVYNTFNDAQQISFDDLFVQRRFSSYIYAESNVYDNRRVEEYTAGLETLLESDRIKESIMNTEHDLWEY